MADVAPLTVGALRVSQRQAEVLSLAAQGYTDNQIAQRLGCSYRTVRTHLERVYAAHGFHSRTKAVVAWMRASGRQGVSPRREPDAARPAEGDDARPED